MSCMRLFSSRSFYMSSISWLANSVPTLFSLNISNSSISFCLSSTHSPLSLNSLFSISANILDSFAFYSQIRCVYASYPLSFSSKSFFCRLFKVFISSILFFWPSWCFLFEMFSKIIFSFSCFSSSYFAYSSYFYAWIYCSSKLCLLSIDFSLSDFSCPIIYSSYTFNSRSYKSISFLFVASLFSFRIFSNEKTFRFEMSISFFNNSTCDLYFSPYNTDTFSFSMILFFELDSSFRLYASICRVRILLSISSVRPSTKWESLELIEDIWLMV